MGKHWSLPRGMMSGEGEMGGSAGCVSEKGENANCRDKWADRERRDRALEGLVREGVEASPVFAPASPPMDVESVAGKEGVLAVARSLELAVALPPPPVGGELLAPSQIDSLPFELKVSVASLLAYGDLMALRACSAEMQAVSDHVLTQQSDSYPLRPTTSV